MPQEKLQATAENEIRKLPTLVYKFQFIHFISTPASRKDYNLKPTSNLRL
jgi:hypothetical protein